MWVKANANAVPNRGQDHETTVAGLDDDPKVLEQQVARLAERVVVGGSFQTTVAELLSSLGESDTTGRKARVRAMRALVAHDLSTRPQLDAMRVNADSQVIVDRLGVQPPWDGTPAPPEIMASLPPQPKRGRAVDKILTISSATDALEDLDLQNRMITLGWTHKGDSVFLLPRRSRGGWLLWLLRFGPVLELLFMRTDRGLRGLRDWFHVTITVERGSQWVTLRFEGRAGRSDARRLSKMIDSLIADGLATYAAPPQSQAPNLLSRGRIASNVKTTTQPSDARPGWFRPAWVWLAVIPSGLGGGIGLIYAGYRARRPWWCAAGGILLATAVVAFGLSSPNDSSSTNNLIGGLILVGWIMAVVLVIAFRRPYLDAMAERAADPALISTARQSPSDELIALADLRDRGILTDDEFDAKKRQILGL